MSNAVTFVDVEGPVRAWLRTQSIGVSDRVFLGLPERCAYPALDMALIDAGIQPGEAPLADAAFTFSAWAAKGSRSTASDVAFALVSLLLSTPARTPLDDTLVFMGAEILLGPVFQPDDDGQPRYLVDAAITVRVP